ncbi:MAG: TonB C-terminal domain-containing protein [Candidatus Obscuribacterales bacterium]|nr:TonB C-terminal domain-containing protein [Candidatus Obscuribacterales bacterium]
MKTFNFANTDRGELEPSVAGALSLVPGLGQFYNGDRLKGWLFLEVGAINFVILLSILCADSISNGIVQFAGAHHFTANISLVKQLGSFKLGHPGATLLFALCLAFIAFSVRDAYDRALNLKNREIYQGHFLELSEATSGSYLAHFALMGALLLLSVFLLIPSPTRTQVTEIEFVSQPQKEQVKPERVNRVDLHNNKAEGMHKPQIPVRPNQAHATPSKPAASQSQQPQAQAAKPQPKPEMRAQQQEAPKPQPIKTEEAPKPLSPVTSPLPAVHPPAPAPFMPSRPMPAAPAPPAPMPAKTMAAANVMHPNSVPVPTNTSIGSPAATPLLAFNKTALASAQLPSIATAPIGGGGFVRPSSQGWMSGKSPNALKTGGGPSAPAVDTSSFAGTGDERNKPTLADTSSNRTSFGRGRSLGDAPKPIAAKAGPAPGDMLVVSPKITSPIGDVGGRGNPDPTAKGKEDPRVATRETVEPDFKEYMAALQRRIRRAWTPPRQPNSKSTIAVFTIGTNGELISLRLQRSSGDSSMDQAALQSIRNSAPFAHLPQYSPDSIDVQFTFDYNVFGGGRQF